MNLTAVQLRQCTPARRLVYGRPADVRPSAHGDVALFPPGTLVAYELCVARRGRLFVFRTLLVEDRLAASVPGVHRRVQLLFTLRARARIERLRHLFTRLEASGWRPAALPDAFFVRLGALLEGRLPRHPILASMLTRDRKESTTPAAPLSRHLALGCRSHSPPRPRPNEVHVNTLPPPNLPRIDPPIQDQLRRDLHDAVDDLIDAGSELDGAVASRVDEAFAGAFADGANPQRGHTTEPPPVNAICACARAPVAPSAFETLERRLRELDLTDHAGPSRASGTSRSATGSIRAVPLRPSRARRSTATCASSDGAIRAIGALMGRDHSTILTACQGRVR